MQSHTKYSCPCLLQQHEVRSKPSYGDWLRLTCPSQGSDTGALPRDGCKEAANVLAPHPFGCSSLPILILDGLLRQVGACESTQYCLRVGKE